jgi:hypothetical protein
MLSSVAKQERPFDATSINEEAAARMSSQIHDHARMPIESAASVARGPCIVRVHPIPFEKPGAMPDTRESRKPLGGKERPGCRKAPEADIHSVSSQPLQRKAAPFQKSAQIADDFDEFPGSPEENGEIPSIRGSRDGDAVRIEK